MSAPRHRPAEGGGRPSPRLRTGSLCTGYGGLDLAVLAALDAALIWCADNDPDASTVVAARFPAARNLGDLTSVDWATVPPVDLVTVGFPCQDISTAGRGAGITEGTRSGLWTQIAEALSHLRPGSVLVENVAALRSRGLSRVLADLAHFGYDTPWICLRASDVGAAHRRDRIFVLAHQPAALPGLLAAAAGAARSQRQRTSLPGLAGPQAPPSPVPLPAPVAGACNDTEPMASWQAHRGRQKKPGRNGNGMRTPPGAAVRLLPTPTVVMTWRTPHEHMAWRYSRGRTQPCDLQAAVLLAGTPPEPGAADGPLLPTPDTGTSPHGHGRRGGRAGNGHQSGQGLDAAVRDLCRAAAGAPAPPLTACPAGPQPQPSPPAVDWGPYEAAVRRWEHALGCPAPRPVEPGPGQRLRLSAEFAEWLMGIPGWITGIRGIPRAAQLRLIGNGVVPQQAAAALRLLIHQAAAFPSSPGLAGQDGGQIAA
jgi:DNA (cytosine-5)-methyltransferase 1